MVTTLRKRVMMRVSQYEKIKGTYVVVFTEGARMSVGLWLDDIPRRKETDGQTATGDGQGHHFNVTMVTSSLSLLLMPHPPHPPIVSDLFGFNLKCGTAFPSFHEAAAPTRQPTCHGLLLALGLGLLLRRR